MGRIRSSTKGVAARDPVEQAIGRSLIVTVVCLLFLGITWPFVSNGGLPQVLWCLFALCGTVGGRLDQPNSGLLPGDEASTPSTEEAPALPSKRRPATSGRA